MKIHRLNLFEMWRLHGVIQKELTSCDDESELVSMIYGRGMDFFCEVGTIVFRKTHRQVEKEISALLLVQMEMAFVENQILVWRTFIRDLKHGN